MSKETCYCAAHGCPLLGVMSTGGDWWCFLHFGKDGAQLQAITTEVNRREWLAKAITDIRMHCHTEAWPDTFKAVQHELAMNQRTDLKHDGKEAIWKWLARLENELQTMCRGAKVKPERQAIIPEAA